MRPSNVARLLSPIVLALAAGLASAPALAQYAKPKPRTSAAPASDETAKAVDKILSDLAGSGDANAAKKAAEDLLRSLAGADKGANELIAAARGLRLVTIVAEATAPKKADAKTTPPAKAEPKPDSKADPKPAGKADEKAPAKAGELDAAAIIGMFKESPAAADALAWNFVVGRDSAPRAVRVLHDLRAANLPVESRPELAAAVALVHDQRDPRAQEWTPGPLEVFEFYGDGRSRFLPIFNGLPCVLLVHVVDNVTSLDEMAWANGRYGHNARIGIHYKAVQYDTPFFKGQQPKKMDGKPYTLQNILKYGGVCVEQAYFAEMVGKAVGCPTATVTAKGDSVGHAWIGYLLPQGRGWAWDLTEGRYDDYEGEQADVYDPQLGEYITDSELQMKADRASTPQDLVRESLARADAAGVLTEPPAALAMMERAVNACPFVPAAWEKMAELAGKKKLAPADLEKWAGALVTLCGTRYPDFAVRILEPLIKTMPEPADQAACWAWTRGKLVDAQRNQAMMRNDLAVALRVREADCLRQGQDEGGAWNGYHEAIKLYGRKTPAVQAAAMRCEKMLAEAHKPPADLVDFWSWAWKQTDRPKKMSADFALGSNWSVFGLKYAAALQKAGDTNRADLVRREIMPKDK